MAYSSITKPSDYFNTVLYTGNGSAGHAITGVGFAPDWTWIKIRSSGSHHTIFDKVRGATKAIYSDTSGAEETVSGHLTSFDSDGFTLGNNTGNGNTNANGATFASWNWLAGGSTSSNSDGSITSTVSANTTAGFSIVTYTGTGSNATIGHGLGSAPAFITVKRRDSADSWQTYHKTLGASKFLNLNNTDAVSTNTNRFGGSEPTTSVFSIGTDAGVNASGGTYVAYCFAEKKGYSKVGNYTGNGSTNGPFLYTGFKPAFFIAKRTDSTGNYHVHDNKRDVDNGVTFELRANTNDAEVDVFAVTGEYRADFLSNGIKTRTTGASVNASGGSYVYIAFAAEPLVSNVGQSIPATAR